MAQSAIVLITGANTGLGFQMVKALCSSDKVYEVLVGGRSLEKAKQAASAAEQEFPSTRSRVQALQVDIESDESIQHAFDEVATNFGRLDVLVNNAGMDHPNELQRAIIILSAKLPSRRSTRSTDPDRCPDDAPSLDRVLEC